MSKITQNDVKKIARLSRIEVAENKCEALSKQLSSIIGWVENLNEVDTKNVDFLSNVHEISLPLFEDKVSDGEKSEEILKNAPDAKYGYFTVPKMIE
jgi:aspartyl-tRNA(Asn)/glutamyl-tRNA(Gln) amidotransferase subunit C